MPTIFILFFSVLVHSLKKKSSIAFSKKGIWVGGGGQFVHQKYCLKKPNTPEYAQDLVITWAKLNSVTALLSPRPNEITQGSRSQEF
jgi:hypothetical protein